MVDIAIKNARDAEQAWEAFYKKYQSKLQDFKITKKIVSEPKPSSGKAAVQSEENRERAAKLIQQKWRFLQQNKDVKVPVRTGMKDDAELVYFLNLNTTKSIKKSLNKEQLTELEKALSAGSWQDAIFQEPNLPYLALTLYQAKKISQQQFYSVLDFAQVRKDFKFQQAYQVLDDNGEFTAAAKEILIPQLIAFSMESEEKVREQIESFRLLLSRLPKSEQTFYATDLGRYAFDPDNINKYLGPDLKGLDSFYVGNRQILHLPFGMKDALGLSIYGLKEYVRPVPRLGVQTINDIEYGVRRDLRPTAMAYPRTKPFEHIHSYKNVIDAEATGHDIAHSKGMSSIPSSMQECLHYFADITRDTFGMQWSKEIWSWTDAEFIHFYPFRKGEANQVFDERRHTRLFCDMLNKGGLPESDDRGAFVVRYHKNNQIELTLTGLNLLMDMIENKGKWKSLKINPANLSLPFSVYYGEMAFLYSQLHLDQIENRKLRLLLLQVYYLFKTNERSIDGYNRFLELVITRQNELLDKFKFAKLSKTDVANNKSGVVNMIVFKFDNKPLSLGVIDDLMLHYSDRPSQGIK